MIKKPNIFIGSSRHAKEYVKSVTSKLEDIAVCCPWYEGNFPVGEATFETLCKKTYEYDFAVFVATPDDGLARDGEEINPVMRDNVLFEHGLFSGAIGRKRTFLITPGGLRLPTDLLGITVLRYDINNCEETLRDCCIALKEQIISEMRLSRISMLPSTTVAISYYKNFIRPLCSALASGEGGIYAGGENINPDGFKFNIIIPGHLERDYTSTVVMLRRENRWQDICIKVNSVHRVYSLNGIFEDKNLFLYDFPMSLSISYEAIRLCQGADFIGKTLSFARCEEREIQNFKKTLTLLINESSFIRNVVELVDMRHITKLRDI